MKVGIVTVTHQSEKYRPNGIELVTNFINSLHHISYEYECIIIDNSSTNHINLNNVHVLRVDDQTIFGLTGAWELGLRKALELNCDIILINNDDLEYNESINKLISYISNDERKDISIYGPVSNGLLGGIQCQPAPINQIFDLTNNNSNMLNGFMFGFTNKFYFNFRKENGDLFDKENYPWGGNEEEFQQRVWLHGARSIMVGYCWISHKKIRGWKQLTKVL